MHGSRCPQLSNEGVGVCCGAGTRVLIDTGLRVITGVRVGAHQTGARVGVGADRQTGTGVRVGAGRQVAAGLRVGAILRVGVGLRVGTGVLVGTGVRVGTGVAVGRRTGIVVGSTTTTGVAVGRRTGVAVGRGTGVAVGRGTGVAVGRGAGVAVGRGTGVAVGRPTGIVVGSTAIAGVAGGSWANVAGTEASCHSKTAAKAAAGRIASSTAAVQIRRRWAVIKPVTSCYGGAGYGDGHSAPVGAQSLARSGGRTWPWAGARTPPYPSAAKQTPSRLPRRYRNAEQRRAIELRAPGAV